MKRGDIVRRGMARAAQDVQALYNLPSIEYVQAFGTTNFITLVVFGVPQTNFVLRVAAEEGAKAVVPDVVLRIAYVSGEPNDALNAAWMMGGASAFFELLRVMERGQLQ